MEPIIPSHHHHYQPVQTEWTWEENKAFENAIAELDPSSPYLFELIALRVPGKTISQIQKHYNELIADLHIINSDLVPPPNYGKGTTSSSSTTTDGARRGAKRPRKRGITWTSEEHELFLIGLEKYGKGDWRSISRNCVVTRTPAQVASHAQKYFIRLQNNQNNPANSTTITTAAPTLAPSHYHYISEPMAEAEFVVAAPAPVLAPSHYQYISGPMTEAEFTVVAPSAPALSPSHYQYTPGPVVEAEISFKRGLVPYCSPYNTIAPDSIFSAYHPY
ncbi:hypothetical protein JRO89_XS08G0107600 [Xanthoceras sorbifolium]|uniref:Transcription factor DIVARICATA-like n=1 Tax=Xanthoceras sorbifolium TaxID=99658 RepID=A0ABQ8HP88_9ROSI|nr:hypothetical protein JRO89_XS08G0107600 [Xanthoceras sorbifolium]